ncbi:MAG TPA: hypothetical protein VL625_04940 [Patescibacteria group bacterium]|jgi:hypothetical protein|nr:hypothetical protein [Patescibacteria group bacterium]
MRSRTEKFLTGLIVLLLLTLIYVQSHGNKTKSMIFSSISGLARSNTHRNLDSTLYNLILADLFLTKSIDYGIYIKEKKDALAEINFAKMIIIKNAGDDQIVDINAKGPNDLRLIEYAVGYSRTALKQSLLVEKLTDSQKKALHDHIQNALDKMLQVQEAEQQSQPEKSKP